MRETVIAGTAQVINLRCNNAGKCCVPAKMLFVISQVFYSDGFSFALWQRAFLDKLYLGGDKDFIFQLTGNSLTYFLQFYIVCRWISR